MDAFVKGVLNQVSHDYKLDYKEMVQRYLMVSVVSLTPVVPSRLLYQEDVRQWIRGDLSFLPSAKNDKEKKDFEDDWGRAKISTKSKQWTGPFGEQLCKEAFQLLGKVIKRPEKKGNIKIDWETDDYMIEVKSGTHYTPGTAHEKILGVPYKYSDVYRLYGKPLKILCIGYAEKVSQDKKYHFLKEEKSPEKQNLLNYFRDTLHVEYQGFTDFLQELHPLLTLDSLSLSLDDTKSPLSDDPQMFLEQKEQTHCS